MIHQEVFNKLKQILCLRGDDGWLRTQGIQNSDMHVEYNVDLDQVLENVLDEVWLVNSFFGEKCCIVRYL